MTRIRVQSFSLSSPCVLFDYALFQTGTHFSGSCSNAKRPSARTASYVALLCLDRAVRARFVDDVAQILRQQFERGIDRQAEVACEFLNLGIAENGLELVFADRKIGARTEPGVHLGVQAALLQRGDQTVEIV